MKPVPWLALKPKLRLRTAAVLTGPEAVAVVRGLMGKTDGIEAAPGTIRGDFSLSKQNNLIHGSDSVESADREIAIWFKSEEIADYQVAGSHWVHDD